MTSYQPKIALTEGQIEFIKKTIQQQLPAAKIYIFGSRASGRAKKFSDVDIAVEDKTPISTNLILKLQSELVNGLPYLVDLVDINSLEPEFKLIIESTAVEI